MPRNDGRVCVYCGAVADLTIDHVVPLSRWREFRLRRRVLDNESNRVLACARCNFEKGRLSPREWLARHPEFERRFRSCARYLSDDVKRALGWGPRR